MPQSKKRHLDYTIKSARCAVAQVVGRSGFCRKDDVRRSFLLIVALFLSVCACRAQGVADVERGKRVLEGNDSCGSQCPASLVSKECAMPMPQYIKERSLD